MFEKYLIIIPIASFALFTSIGLVNNYRTTNLSTTCASCPDNLPKCSQTDNYVLGGLDIIPYFYNETYKGEHGNESIYSSYNGFNYLFTTKEHKAIFDTNPEQYQPQYGGYCAWGVAGEFCPDYPWSVECLGPSGNWQHGTIFSQKLYFFLYDEAKEKFISNIETNIETGDERWLNWFSIIDEKMNTDCYVA